MTMIFESLLIEASCNNEIGKITQNCVFLPKVACNSKTPGINQNPSEFDILKKLEEMCIVTLPLPPSPPLPTPLKRGGVLATYSWMWDTYFLLDFLRQNYSLFDGKLLLF